MELILNFLPSMVVYGVIFCAIFIRYTPFGTAVIVDRKTHYCKTKPRGGLYFFNPFTDKITTCISTTQTSKSYSDIFETYDTNYIRVSFNVTYHAESVDAVLLHLKNDKRSIDDLIKCAIDSTFSSFEKPYIFSNQFEVSKEAARRATLACIPFAIIIDSLSITNMTSLPQSYAQHKFKPHVCKSDGPIDFN